MLRFLTLIFVASAIAWVALAVSLIGIAGQPGGLIASYATLSQMGITTVIMTVCGATEVMSKRLDRVHSELVATREMIAQRIRSERN